MRSALVLSVFQISAEAPGVLRSLGRQIGRRCASGRTGWAAGGEGSPPPGAWETPCPVGLDSVCDEGHCGCMEPHVLSKPADCAVWIANDAGFVRASETHDKAAISLHVLFPFLPRGLRGVVGSGSGFVTKFCKRMEGSPTDSFHALRNSERKAESRELGVIGWFS